MLCMSVVFVIYIPRLQSIVCCTPDTIPYKLNVVSNGWCWSSSIPKLKPPDKTITINNQHQRFLVYSGRCNRRRGFGSLWHS